MSEGERQPLPEGTVTVLSSDLVGSTQLNQRLGDEAASQVEREIDALGLEQVEKHRGIVIKETGDGLMVAFQSARRAVACAQEIQRAVARRNRLATQDPVELRIGLHTGEVLEDDGDLKGETIILAKRIEESAAPGAIFASDTVHGVLGTARSELEERGEFELKGISDSWPLYEVPWADEEVTGVLPGHERSPYVGRAPERAKLVEAATRAREGAGSLVLIAGEAGVGKTRLTQELSEEARRQGMVVLVGQSPDQEGAPPYLPWIQQIEESTRVVTAEQLRGALGESAPQIAKLMPELRERFPDIPEPVELPPDQERRYLLHAFSDFVERAAAGGALVLVFEDLHWADESTLLLLQHVAQRAREMQLLMIGTYRHTELKPGRVFATMLPELLRQRLAVELLLDRLSEQGVSDLLQGRAGRKPPPELVELVYSETEGNPYFVEEVFRHLNEAGKLFDDNGQWRSGIQIADTEVPRGVGLVIGQRLERVSEACRKILTIAAVSGRVFRFDLLAAFHGVDEDELLEALEEASRATLVEDVSTDREARYGFVHEQIRQTLLSLLSFPRRQRLHLRMADALESLYGAQADARAPEIAHHLYQAGAVADSGRTSEWLARAAERALAALAFEDALRDLDAAQSVLPETGGDAEAEIHVLRSRALRGLGRIDDALAAIGSAVSCAGDPARRARIQQERVGLRLDVFQRNEAIADLEMLLDGARNSADRAFEAELMLELGRAYYLLSLDDPDAAPKTREAYEAAYALAKEIGNRRAMCQALIPTTWFTDYWHDYHPQALANNDEAGRLAAELDDERLILEAASARLRLVPADEATIPAEEIRERLEARSDPLRLQQHYFWMMWHYYVRADFERCVECCESGIELAAQLGTPPVQYPSIEALALTDLGRFDEAFGALSREVADDEHPFGRCMQQFAVAVWEERLGALDRAERTARHVLEEAGRLRRTWMQAVMLDLLAVIAARRGSEGADLSAYIRERSEATGFHPSAIARAEASLLQGDYETALTAADGIAAGGGRIGLARGRRLALGIALRALVGLARWGELLERADAALPEIEESHFRTLAWRARACRARARSETGDEAGAAEDVAAAREILNELAATIPDPELRSAFQSQPEVADLLYGSST